MAHGYKFQVFYDRGGGTQPHPLGPWDEWQDAKVFRDTTFMSWKDCKACWIMRSNPSLNIAQHKWGETLRRNNHELRKAAS